MTAIRSATVYFSLFCFCVFVTNVGAKPLVKRGVFGDLTNGVGNVAGGLLGTAGDSLGALGDTLGGIVTGVGGIVDGLTGGAVHTLDGISCGVLDVATGLIIQENGPCQDDKKGAPKSENKEATIRS